MNVHCVEGEWDVRSCRAGGGELWRASKGTMSEAIADSNLGVVFVEVVEFKGKWFELHTARCRKVEIMRASEVSSTAGRSDQPARDVLQKTMEDFTRLRTSILASPTNIQEHCINLVSSMKNDYRKELVVEEYMIV